ncbi:hypothetical protein EDB85DRAFT_1956392 [Lactarius pseudohatsudake]|nr:hypothetical protein EDB85DRAFT_1956392 [Lactarius pseudohatsudake]
MHPGIKHVALVSLCLLIKLVCTVLQSKSRFPAPRRSYPSTHDPPTWALDYLSPIPMNTDGTKHHQLPNADPEWAALVPNNGTLYLGPPSRPNPVFMIHKLHCLDVFRHEIIEARPQVSTQYCLFFMQFAVLCHVDLAVDPVLGPELEAEDSAKTNRCIDRQRISQKLDERENAQSVLGR